MVSSEKWKETWKNTVKLFEVVVKYFHLSKKKTLALAPERTPPSFLHALLHSSLLSHKVCLQHVVVDDHRAFLLYYYLY